MKSPLILHVNILSVYIKFILCDWLYTSLKLRGKKIYETFWSKEIAELKLPQLG